MKRFFKLFAVSLFLILLASQLFAAEGIVTYVKGKVEVQRNSKWIPLNVGDKIAQSEMVNTGFQSEAKIKLMDSVLYLGPVTRVTLETLKSSEANDKVNVYLATGSTRSKVEHTDAKRVNYTVRTAVAVASVRGTDWIMDSAGNVSCLEGGVAVALISSLPTGKNLTASAAKSDSDSEEDGKEEIPASATEAFEDSVELPTGGLLITANQTITVTQTAPVTAAQTLSSKTAGEIINTVSTAASKESVSSAKISTVESATSSSDSSATSTVIPVQPVTPVEPDNPTPVVPDNPTPVVPDNPTPVVPDNPTPVVPDNPTPVVPDNPTPVVPDNPTPVVPETPATGSVTVEITVEE